MVVYKITNSVNGKIYIGQTVRPLKLRIGEHKRHTKLLISKALRKYSINQFKVEVIDESDDIGELNEKEIKWISFYDCMVPNGYNQCVGGENTIGFNHREDSKKKMSDFKKKAYLGDGNPFFGKKHSEEQKKKWSDERKVSKKEIILRAQKISIETHMVRVVNLDTGEVFNSILEAALSCNAKPTHITRVCRGRRSKTRGFRWAYAD